jgi:hypothetical protein
VALTRVLSDIQMRDDSKNPVNQKAADRRCYDHNVGETAGVGAMARRIRPETAVAVPVSGRCRLFRAKVFPDRG